MPPGSSTPISRTDAAGNTCQLRMLSDGRRCEGLKNFPAAGAVETPAGEIAGVQWAVTPYYRAAMITQK